MKQLNIYVCTYSILATSLDSTVTVAAKLEVVTALESTIYNSFIHNRPSNRLTFCKFLTVLFIFTQLNMP